MGHGDQLEQDVQQIYSYLLNMKDEGVAVGRNVVLAGRSGAMHEIDVFYEFSRAGIAHKVAIECKDWQSAVTKGQIQEFESKIRDVGNLIGVVVSRRGFQSGADTFANFNGILTIRLDEFPTFPMLIAQRIKSVALPDETYVGEPFWVIMEVKNGKITGSHFATGPGSDGVPLIPLTYSKFHAQKIFQEAELDTSKWAIRGLPRHAFRAFLIMLDLYERRNQAKASVFYLPPGATDDAQFISLPVSREDLIREYFDGCIPSIE